MATNHFNVLHRILVNHQYGGAVNMEIEGARGLLPQDMQTATLIDAIGVSPDKVALKIKAYAKELIENAASDKKKVLEALKRYPSKPSETIISSDLLALEDRLGMKILLEQWKMEQESENRKEAIVRIWRFLGDENAKKLDFRQLGLTSLPSIFQKRIFIDKLGAEGMQEVRNAISYEGDKAKIASILKDWVRLGARNENREKAAQLILNFLDKPEVSKLKFRSFNLSTLPDIFHLGDFKTKLEDLDLSHNHFNTEDSFPRGMTHLKALEGLNLEECELTRVPRFIYLLSSLIYLDLSNNRINGVFVGSKQHNKLETLYLHSNEELRLSGQHLLTSLSDLDVNDIEPIDPAYAKLPKSCSIYGFSDKAIAAFTGGKGYQGPQFLPFEGDSMDGDSSE